MKKICGLHLFLIIFIILSFIALMLFFSKSSHAANFQRSRPSASKSSSVSRKELVKQRRERIMRNGDINNFYPQPFSIRWVIINDRSYIVLQPRR